MRRNFLAVCLAALLLAAAPTGAQEEEPSPLERALAKPTATGLLVSRIVPNSQALAAKLVPGDILVSYGGHATPDVPALNEAMRLAEGREHVEVVVVRDGWEKTFTLVPGTIGVRLLPVKKGEGRELLPPETVAGFDFSPLAKKPRDSWYCFYREGEKCGFGRIEAKVVGRTVYVLTEEIIDLESEIQDHEVVCATTLASRPVPKMTAFRDRMNDWERYGLHCESEEGRKGWTTVVTGPGMEEAENCFPLPPRTFPVYMVETLAEFMPFGEKACIRFLPLYEGNSEMGLEGALVGSGWGEVTLWEEKRQGYRFEWRQIDGEVLAVFWVDAERRLFLADYGVVQAVLGPKDEVLADQPETIRARMSR